MIYKSILLSVLLLPISSYSKSTETRLKELKETQFQKELESSNIFKMSIDKAELLDKYKENALNNLKLSNPEKELFEIEALLNQLIDDFESELTKAKNLKQIFKNGIINSSSSHSDALRIALLLVVLEKRIIDKLGIKYEACVEELIKLNVELENLKK